MELITLQGEANGRRRWTVEIVKGELPTCNICDQPADFADPDCGFRLHSGSPVCGLCIRQYS